MKYPKLPKRISDLDKGYTQKQMLKYAEQCVEQALMSSGATDEERIRSIIENNIERKHIPKWAAYVQDILVKECNQSERMAEFLVYKFASQIPSKTWKGITNEEIIHLIPKRELDVSALILLGKRINNLLMERNTWD